MRRLMYTFKDEPAVSNVSRLFTRAPLSVSPLSLLSHSQHSRVGEDSRAAADGDERVSRQSSRGAEEARKPGRPGPPPAEESSAPHQGPVRFRFESGSVNVRDIARTRTKDVVSLR